MAFDPTQTRARLERLLREAEARTPERPIEREAPVLRARRAIRLRYGVIAVSFVVLSAVLTAGAVWARDRLDGTDGVTGPTTTSTETPTTTPTEPPPQVRIIDPPDDPTNQTTAVFTFELTGRGTAECTLNGTSLGACESGIEVPDVPEGENTFEVRGVGEGGELGPPDTYTWTVDLTGPTITFESIVLAFAPGEEEPECLVDDVDVDCSVPVDDLSPEEHTFEVVLPGARTLRWILDPTPQQVSFSPTGPGGFPPTSTIQLAFELDEEGTVECSVEGRSIDCVSGSLEDLLAIASGEPVDHTIELVPSDLLGTRGSSRTFTWSFDHDEAVG